jgi:hypothetical protein
MKPMSKLILLGLMISATSANMAAAAELTQIVRCQGNPNGSHLSIEQLGHNSIVFATVTTDADESELPARSYSVDSVERGGKKAPPREFALWIRESVERSPDQAWEGTAVVRASDEKGSIVMNFGNSAGQHFLIGAQGDVEPLTCEVTVE